MIKISWPALALVAAGCAATQAPPTDQIASSLAAVRGAEEAGAAKVPQAALHLKLAEEQLERARETDDRARAEALALRAGEDAELALALARAQQTDARLARAGASGQGGEQPAPVAPSPAPNTQPPTESRTP
ncbi:MAG: DUF4398 domain-containing protein [Polyangiales bacterium]